MAEISYTCFEHWPQKRFCSVPAIRLQSWPQGAAIDILSSRDAINSHSWLRLANYTFRACSSPITKFRLYLSLKAPSQKFWKLCLARDTAFQIVLDFLEHHR